MAERTKGPETHLSTCKGCGAGIVWATTDTGAKIPLDANSGQHTYVLVIHDGEARAKKAGSYCSHFLTCPKANEFSGKSTKKSS